ncbi:MAG: hypothetical protein JXA20_00105 [Spirochaetes bacterium]|nr:hypothetical protein [Spirochaetota bacterium]
MAIGKAEKAAYNDEIKDIKSSVDKLQKKVNETVSKRKKMPAIAPYYVLESVVNLLLIIEDYLKMNDLSVEMLGIKNETFLNNARKEFYKVLQQMEEIVGKDVDRSLRENDEYIDRIERLNPHQILKLVQRIHFVLRSLRNKVGETSKWKWSFVELQSRVAVITKNITKFSDIAKLRDPRVEYFYDRRDLMQLCKESLTEAARQYRAKYEMAGKSREDLKRSIEFLSSLRRIHVIFGESEDAAKLKNTIDAARMALESEDKSKEDKKAKSG